MDIVESSQNISGRYLVNIRFPKISLQKFEKESTYNSSCAIREQCVAYDSHMWRDQLAESLDEKFRIIIVDCFFGGHFLLTFRKKRVVMESSA